MSQWSHLYNNRRWRALRADQLRKEPLCRYCKRQGKVTVATVCDHIIPHKGNLQLFWQGPFASLCAECHSSVKAKEEAGKGIIGSGVDGMPIDPGHHWNA